MPDKGLRGTGVFFTLRLEQNFNFQTTITLILFFIVPSLNLFLIFFLPVVVDCHCSFPKSMKSDIPYGSVLSPIIFVLFGKDLLSRTSSRIQSYVDDSTLCYSIRIHGHPFQDFLIESRKSTMTCLTSDLSLILDWGGNNLVVPNASKAQFLHLLVRYNILQDFPLLH